MLRIVNIRDWPFTTKLVAGMTALVVVSLVAVVVIGSNVASRELERGIKTNLTLLSEVSGVRVGGVLADQVLILRSNVASDDDTLDAVVASNASYTGSEQEIAARLLELDAEWQAAPEAGIPLIHQTLTNIAADEMNDLLEITPQFAEIFITDRYGAVVATTNRTSDYYQADEDWWQAGWNNGEGAIALGEPVLDESAGVVAIEIVVPIVDENTGETIGVLKGVYTFQEVVDLVAEVEAGGTVHAYAVDAGANFVTGSDVEFGTQAPQALALGQRIFAGSGTELDVIDERGQRTIVSYAPITTNGLEPAVEELGWVMVIDQDVAEGLAPIRQLRIVTVAVTFVATLAALGLAFLISRFLARQVDEIDKVFRAAAIGEFDQRAQVLSGDELGRTAQGVNGLLDYLVNLLRGEQARFQGIIESATDAVITVDQDHNIVLFNPAAEAIFGVSAREALDQPLNNFIPERFHQTHSRHMKNYERTGETGRGMGRGRDLTALHADGTEFPVEANISQVEVTGQKYFTVILREITARKAVEADVAEMVGLIIDQAASSAEVAGQAASIAQSGDQAVEQTIAAMGRIRDNTQETARRMKRLGEASQEISEVVRLIEELSDQTTVLALNASIQAASAGEAGRGFPVVAEEVQRLAERATSETRRIEDLVKSIQAETNEAVVGVEEATREVVEGSQLAQEAGERVNELSALVEHLSGLIQHVTDTTAQQTTASLAALTGGSPAEAMPGEQAPGGNGARVGAGGIVVQDDGRGS